MEEKILLKDIDVPDMDTVEVYVRHGGYDALKKSLRKMSPEDVVDEVRKSGLRGRGGAGFPTGMKLEFVHKDTNFPKYVICNLDEGEPGTFKDRELVEKKPHSILEGMVISGYAVGAETGYVYIRGEYTFGAGQMEKAIEEARDKGFLGKDILGSDFNFDIYVHRGAGSYICGEETALMESLEGKAGQPRMKPPFPVNVGIWGKPTALNNAETLANLPSIVMNGGEWYSKIGIANCTGTKLFSLSGDVKRPGLYELPMGITLRELIYEHGGGIQDGNRLKAILPGGVSSPLLTEEHLNVNLDFNSLSEAGSMMGSGAVIVMDDKNCMVEVAMRLVRFFEHESCGKCTPCREGTTWITKILDRILKGEGREEDIDTLLDVSTNIQATTFCGLGEVAVNPVLHTLKHFRDDYEMHIRENRCVVC